MIAFLITALSTRVGQAVVIGLGVTALFFSWLALHDNKVAKRATTEVVRSLNADA
jgi:hypothetical protein